MLLYHEYHYYHGYWILMSPNFHRGQNKYGIGSWPEPLLPIVQQWKQRKGFGYARLDAYTYVRMWSWVKSRQQYVWGPICEAIPAQSEGNCKQWKFSEIQYSTFLCSPLPTLCHSPCQHPNLPSPDTSSARAGWWSKNEAHIFTVSNRTDRSMSSNLSHSTLYP